MCVSFELFDHLIVLLLVQLLGYAASKNASLQKEPDAMQEELSNVERYVLVKARSAEA